jgi:membrane protein required for colicin V production
MLVPLIWLGYRGFVKGFIIELASLVALILGIYAALHFSYYASDFLVKYFTIREKYLPVASFILTFIVVVVVVYGIGKIIEKIVDMVALGFLNKLMGGVLGIFKAVLFLSILLLVINTFDSRHRLITPKNQENSMLYKPIAAVIPFLLPRLSLDKLPDFDKLKEKEKDTIPDTIPEKKKEEEGLFKNV